MPLFWLFRRAIFQGELFAFRDAAHYYLPFYRYVHESWATGLPLWNPLDGIGQPLLADPTAAVLYPGKLIFCLPLEYATCFALYVVFHLWLGGVGTFFCARVFRCTTTGALLAGLSYELSGQVLFQYCNPIYCVGAAWLPWAILLLEKLLTGAGQRRTVITLAIVWCMMVWGGEPQIAYHTVLLAFFRIVFLRRSQQLPAVKTLVAAGCLAGLLAAAQVLPTVEWARLSDRSMQHSPRSIWDWCSDSLEHRHIAAWDGMWKRAADDERHASTTYDFSVGPWRWGELLFPNLSGSWFPVHQRWIKALPAEGRTWTPSLYLGWLPIVLALTRARLRTGVGQIRWLTWTAFLCALAALGTYGLGWLYNEFRFAMMGANYEPADMHSGFGGLYWFLTVTVPGYTGFRYPAKWWTIATLCLSLLAGRAWPLWLRVGKRSGYNGTAAWTLCRCYLLWSAIFVLPSLIAASCLIWFGHVPAAAVFGPFDADGAGVGLMQSLGHVIIVGAICWWLLQWSRHGQRRLVWANAVMLCVVMLDLAVAQSGLIQTVADDNTVILAKLAETCVYRCKPELAYPANWLTEPSRNRFAELQRSDRATLMPKHHFDVQSRSLRSSVSMSAADFESIWSGLMDASPEDDRLSNQNRVGLLSLFGAEWVIAGATDFDLPNEQFDQLTSTVLMHNAGAFPRGWLVERWEHLAELGKAELKDRQSLQSRIQHVFCPNGELRDFRHVAVIEHDGPVPPASLEAPPDSAKPPDCVIESPAADRLSIRVSASRTSLLVIRDQYFPGWKATVRRDDQPAKAAQAEVVDVLRVNRCMRGIFVEPGTSIVELRYQPRTVFIGCIVSGLAWLGALVQFARRQPIG